MSEIIMVCVCGAVLPNETPTYPMRAQNIGKIINGQRKKIWCTAIIKCKNRLHAPDTEWNYLEWAIDRGNP